MYRFIGEKGKMGKKNLIMGYYEKKHNSRKRNGKRTVKIRFRARLSVSVPFPILRASY